MQLKLHGWDIHAVSAEPDRAAGRDHRPQKYPGTQEHQGSRPWHASPAHDHLDLNGAGPQLPGGSMMSAACRSAWAIRSRALTFRASSTSSESNSRNGVKSAIPGSPSVLVTRLALAP